MKNKDQEDGPITSDPENDEVEILEIVGLDEDGEEIGFEEHAEPETIPASTPGAPASQDRERLIRLHADFENFKKRSEKEAAENRRYASQVVVERLLPIIDNFERALVMEPSSNGDHAFRQGVELIYRQLMEELKKEGLVQLDALGCKFDPNLHDAVETRYDDDHPPDTVSKELLKGYLFQERLIRPALVRVNLAPEKGNDPEGQAD